MDSDWDFIEVHDKLPKDKRGSHKISYGFDIKKFSLSHFMDLAVKGNPAALEAMFAPDEFVSFDKIWHLRQAFRADAAAAAHAYTAVQASMLELSGNKGIDNFERMEHDYSGIAIHGRFDPTEYGVHLSQRGI